MAPLTRRVLGVGLAVCAMVGGLVTWGAQGTRLREAAHVKAQAEVDAQVAPLLSGLDALAKGVAQKAERGARLEAIAALLKEITSDSDVSVLAKTFEDFESEAFFEPFASVGPHAFFLGTTPLFSTDASLTPKLVPLVTAATTAGTASAFVEHGGGVWAVGVGRSEKTNPQQQPALLALAQKVTPAMLESLAGPLDVGVMLVPANQLEAAVAAGKTGALERLKHQYNSMRADDTGCCARKQWGPSLELLVHREPAALLAAAEAETSQSALGIFAVAGLAAVLALVWGFRPAPQPAPETQLLRDTAEQLRQSQEQLQRLSQNLELKTTPHLGGPPPVDDGLGSTQAAVQTSRYEIIAPLGEGGMARVAVAVVRGAEGFKRTFVLKRLRPELATNTEIVNQFIDEARLGASLVHSNIVPVFDFGRDADGYYLAQEYILGRDVDALITASMSQRGRALEQPFVLHVAQEALKALGYAHTRRNDAGKAMGLVHRDVSPNNLMVSARGEVKLLDFGIVKSADRVTQTQAGVVKGNLFFMSPEQARALETDPRSDLFSLGMVLVSAVTGTPLYSGNGVYELMQRAAAGPTDADRQRVREQCGALAPVILRALSLDPAERFADAEAFGRALLEVGPAASTAELQKLMEQLFSTAFAEERQKFAVTA